MAASLHQVHLKLDRAEKHLQSLKDEIVPFARSHPYEAVPEFDGHQTRIFLRFRVHLDPGLPAIVGDCVHNLRSSLDYLMGQLGLLNGHQLDERMPLFPIFLDPLKYARKAKYVEEFVRAKTTTAPAIIERLQPNRRSDHPLWLLHKLSNIDKHRKLNVAVAGVFKDISVFKSVGTIDLPITQYHLAGVLYDGAALATLNMTRSEYKDHGVNVDIHGPVVVMLQETGPWGTQPVEVLVEDILAHIRTIVIPAFDAFF